MSKLDPLYDIQKMFFGTEHNIENLYLQKQNFLLNILFQSKDELHILRELK